MCYLYPKTFKVEIIYKNNAVITESEFSFLFQVIDIGLVETVTAKIMRLNAGIYDPMTLHIAGTTSTAVFLQIFVNKLNEIILEVTPGNKNYIIYYGPIVEGC